MKVKIKENWGYVVVALYILSVTFFVFFEGEDVYIQIHDNLDSNITWYKMLKDHHLFWAKDVDMPFLGGGKSRNMMPSQLLAYTWLYMLFPTFYAFIIGGILKVVLSVAGSIYLVRSVCRGQFLFYKNIVILCGLIYGLMPVFPTSGFAFASLPFLMGVLYNLYYNNDKRLLAALFFYPVFSRLATFGVFICGFLLLFFALNWIAKRKPLWRMLGAFVSLVAGYLIMEYRIVYYMLVSDEVSIKFSRVQDYASLNQVLKTAFQVFVNGHYHSGSMHRYIILPTCCVGLLVINMYYIKNSKMVLCLRDKANWLMVWLVVNCLLYGFDDYEPLKDLIGKIIPKLRNFSIARTLWFNPFLWSFLFCIIVCRLLKKGWKKSAYGIAFLEIFVLMVFPSKDISYNDYAQNVCNKIYEYTGIELPGVDKTTLTYEEFYSEDLFAAIKEDIGYTGEPSVAFGMHPAVLNYNTITTLDGYSSVYPQRYKEQFRQLIEPDLDVDQKNRKYFDNLGIRAYLYSDEIGYQPIRNLEKSAANLRIDMDVFDEMGGKYVFSRVEVLNSDELGLSLVGIYQEKNSLYTIYLYEI